MKVTRALLAVIPPLVMIAVALLLPGIEQWIAAFGSTAKAKMTLGRIGLSLPYALAAAIGVIALFAANGSINIKTAGCGVAIG